MKFDLSKYDAIAVAKTRQLMREIGFSNRQVELVVNMAIAIANESVFKKYFNDNCIHFNEDYLEFLTSSTDKTEFEETIRRVTTEQGEFVEYGYTMTNDGGLISVVFQYREQSINKMLNEC